MLKYETLLDFSDDPNTYRIRYRHGEQHGIQVSYGIREFFTDEEYCWELERDWWLCNYGEHVEV